MYHLQHVIAPKYHSFPLISTYSYPEGNVLLLPPSMLKTSSLSKVDVLAKLPTAILKVSDGHWQVRDIKCPSDKASKAMKLAT